MESFEQDVIFYGEIFNYGAMMNEYTDAGMIGDIIASFSSPLPDDSISDLRANATAGHTS